ncbi:MAG: hypothetical protein RL494_658, partial [Bacteroidota bacterium]
MFHKEGFKIILIASLLFVVAIVAAGELLDIAWLKTGIQLVALLFYIIILQFFRNPNRS